MSTITELVETANTLCKNLERLANDDKKFCSEIQLWLDNYSWEAYRMANNLKEISKYIGE